MAGVPPHIHNSLPPTNNLNQYQVNNVHSPGRPNMNPGPTMQPSPTPNKQDVNYNNPYPPNTQATPPTKNVMMNKMNVVSPAPNLPPNNFGSNQNLAPNKPIPPSNQAMYHPSPGQGLPPNPQSSVPSSLPPNMATNSSPGLRPVYNSAPVSSSPSYNNSHINAPSSIANRPPGPNSLPPTLNAQPPKLPYQQNFPSQPTAPNRYPPNFTGQINPTMPPLVPSSQPISAPPPTSGYNVNGPARFIAPPPINPNTSSHLTQSQTLQHQGVQGQPPLPNMSQPSSIRYPPGNQNLPPQQAMPPYQPGPAAGPTMPAQGHYPAQPHQFGAMQGLNQQMDQLSVSRSGFSQLWGHQIIDLMQCRNVLPEQPVEPPQVKLGQQFEESVNCHPDIFRCTVTRIPESNALLQKSRLPFGILIHPFKDLNHLPVIQCSAIVRCRACRTYINPFVYFVDSKRWKCNLCYRVNDLPEDFQYDPVSKTYGDPTRRPEVKSATIEFIAPGEYMLRPPQPAVYLFLLDVSQIARESGYLQVFCDTLKGCIEQLPGDARTQVGFICYDAAVHFYCLGEGLTRPREMTVIDIEDIFLPSPDSLLVNLRERREMVLDLLDVLPQKYSTQGVPASALGAALQAANKLMAPTGGRITVFQTCLPNVGPGGLTSREDPNARSSKDVAHLNPATDFYKRLALDCSGVQVAVDLFLLNSQYSDLATLSGMSKFSGGNVHHIPLYKSSRTWQAQQLHRMLNRYLTRKIGFEAVMRVRCTRGIAVHSFHGNFFVRSTDLLSLPNVSPDAGFGMQLNIEESLSDVQQVCFQAALLYTSSKGERRIRVHTLCLPVANSLTDVLHSADQQCIIGLLAKMAVDRSLSSSLSDAREALSNVAVDALGAHKLAQNLPTGTVMGGLQAPACLRLLPLYLLALLKYPAFRTGTSTRLDDRVAAMCGMKSQPLVQLMRAVYPDLYPIHQLSDYIPQDVREPSADREESEEEYAPDPPRLHLSAEKVNSNGAYLLDDGENFIIYLGHAVDPMYLSETFGVEHFQALPDEMREMPKLQTEQNYLLQSFMDKLNDDRPYPANVIIVRDNSQSRLQFTERLVDDRVESALSYYEFLQHIKTQMK